MKTILLNTKENMYRKGPIMITSKLHIQNFSNKFIHIFGIIFLFFTFVYTYRNFNNLIVITFGSIVMVVTLIVLFIRFKTQIDNLTNRQMYLFLLLFSIFMIISMTYTSYIMLSKPLNDLGTVYYSVGEIIKYGHISTVINQYTTCAWSTHTSNNDYFVIYPNNQFILFFLLCYYKLLSFSGIFVGSNLSNFMGSLLNVVMIFLTILFGFLSCKKVWKNSGALMYLILSSFFLPYYINACRYYTDTLSMPFTSCSIFLLLQLQEAKDRKNKIIYSSLTGIILALGILLKGSLYVLLVAVVIYFILTIKNFRQISLLLVMIFSLSSINFIWSQYINHCSWIDTSHKNELQVPVTHWIMMASIGNGGFRQQDLDYTLSFKTEAAKTNATINMAIKRIKSYNSLPNYLNFEFDKVGLSLADGKFAESEQLSWYEKKTWIYDYILEDGKHYNLFYTYITIFIGGMYILIFISFICEVFKKKITKGLLVNLCFMGMVLFFMLWEVKSRYFMNFTPIYFMCAVNALDGIGKFKNFSKK